MKITWKSASYGFTNGYVGMIRLFSFGYDGTMPKGTVTEKPFKLVCTLPQVDVVMCKDTEECERVALKILKDFISYIKSKSELKEER